LYYVFCFFFFSSRRRHTRWPRDWSSDVCSSDLSLFPVRHSCAKRCWLSASLPRTVQPIRKGYLDRPVIAMLGVCLSRTGVWAKEIGRACVGKECRCRWSWDDEKKKNVIDIMNRG